MDTGKTVLQQAVYTNIHFSSSNKLNPEGPAFCILHKGDGFDYVINRMMDVMSKCGILRLVYQFVARDDLIVYSLMTKRLQMEYTIVCHDDTTALEQLGMVCFSSVIHSIMRASNPEMTDQAIVRLSEIAQSPSAIALWFDSSRISEYLIHLQYVRELQECEKICVFYRLCGAVFSSAAASGGEHFSTEALRAWLTCECSCFPHIVRSAITTYMGGKALEFPKYRTILMTEGRTGDFDLSSFRPSRYADTLMLSHIQFNVMDFHRMCRTKFCSVPVYISAFNIRVSREQCWSCSARILKFKAFIATGSSLEEAQFLAAQKLRNYLETVEPVYGG
ncbi:MAG: hypothetical protein JSS82_07420 [Bacteroidetes bacterium]|nr:hypothetical protein [Bacteroidota bacterium]